MFIPERIKVGYQERSGTYTGQLAYIIYYDVKGVLRKEKSWESWRHKKIDPSDFNNVPTSGFVLNKGVGGQRESWGYNARNEYIRVFDPRNFEFEISVANLLFILQETNCDKGKGLEGEFVYAWQGTELVLLPVGCQEYAGCQNFTALQGKKVASKDMVPGTLYATNKNVELLYVGRLMRHQVLQTWNYKYNNKSNFCDVFAPAVKCYVFYDTATKDFVFEKALNKIAKQTSTEIHAEYHVILNNYMQSMYGSPVVSLEIAEVDPAVFAEPDNGRYYKRYYNRETTFDEGTHIYTCKHYYGTSYESRPMSEIAVRRNKYKLDDGHVLEDELDSRLDPVKDMPTSNPTVLIFRQASGATFFYSSLKHQYTPIQL